MKYLITSLLFVSIFARDLTNVHNCGSPDAEVLAVDISPCQPIPRTQGPSCQLQRNTTTTIIVDFRTKVNTRNVTTVVHGIASGSILKILFALASKDGEEVLKFEKVDTNACVHNNVDHCNITQGETLRYTNSLFVEPIYPQLRLSVKWEVRDDQNRDLVCLLIPVEII